MCEVSRSAWWEWLVWFTQPQKKNKKGKQTLFQVGEAYTLSEVLPLRAAVYLLEGATFRRGALETHSDALKGGLAYSRGCNQVLETCGRLQAFCER